MRLRRLCAAVLAAALLAYAGGTALANFSQPRVTGVTYPTGSPIELVPFKRASDGKMVFHAVLGAEHHWDSNYEVGDSQYNRYYVKFDNGSWRECTLVGTADCQVFPSPTSFGVDVFFDAWQAGRDKSATPNRIWFTFAEHLNNGSGDLYAQTSPPARSGLSQLHA
jgi:hypothetical protein